MISDCDKIFYTCDAYIIHLKTKHPSFHKYKCHLCDTTHITTESLMSVCILYLAIYIIRKKKIINIACVIVILQHYKLHDFCKFQCLYCLCGTESLNEMQQHLSAFHYNRLPQILERSLPPKVYFIRINQLKQTARNISNLLQSWIYSYLLLEVIMLCYQSLGCLSKWIDVVLVIICIFWMIFKRFDKTCYWITQVVIICLMYRIYSM